jgi:hypothetical protein
MTVERGFFLRFLGSKSDNVTQFSAGTALTSAFLLGQGVLGNLWLLLALGGWFAPWVVMGVVISSVIGGSAFAWPYISQFICQMRSVWHDLRGDTWGWQLIAFITCCMWLAGATSIGRPLAGDAAAFYMALPKVIAASHRLAPLPGYEAFTQVGLQGEMHYAALMALGSPDAAQLFAWVTMLAGAVMLLAIGSQIGLGRRGQWIALTCVFTSSSVIWLSGDGKVDLFAAALGLAAYYWALQVWHGEHPLPLRLTGLFAGFAVVAKLSYVPVLLPGIGVLVLWKFIASLRSRAALISSSLSALSLLAKTGFWMVLAILPHLIKNYMLFDNLLAPFSTSGASWADQTWFRPETTRHILLTYPLALTFGQYWAQYGNLSPLVLAFLPLALLLPKPRFSLNSPLLAITLASLLGLISWMIIRPSLLSPRYILATLLMFIPLAARSAEYVSRTDSERRFLHASVMACIFVTLVTVGLYFLNVVFFPLNTKHYLTGSMSQCERDGAYCRAMTALNNEAEPGTRVFLASWYRYWLRPDLLQCLSGATDYSSVKGQTSEDTMSSEAHWLAIYERGFRYLLADKSSFSVLIDNLDIAHPPPWLEIVPLFEEGHLAVYRLEFNDPPVGPLVECRQINAPAWDLIAR